ncbi:hypothetical protein AAE026_29290 [Bradyrhizobium sp. DN5]|uniref:hypothetical protein n=1 Tax=Bradyrhizobium sp. DN5 TaxID=3056950 RepID=UPI0035262CB9
MRARVAMMHHCFGDSHGRLSICRSDVSIARFVGVARSGGSCVWLFREKLNTLLPFLRMKYKDFDVSFRLDQAEKEAALILPRPPSPDLEPTPEEKSRFEKVAEHSPRAAILEKRAELEQVVKTAAELYVSTSVAKSWKTLPLTSAIRPCVSKVSLTRKHPHYWTTNA